MRSLRQLGVQASLLSAVLFGAGTPAAKLLLGTVSPWLLAGLLYLGSGLGLGVLRLAIRAAPVHLRRSDLLPLVGAVLAGGVVGPLLLLVGLARLPASGASLLLNAEAVFTAVVAWAVFKEHVDRRVAFGLVGIVAGAVVLTVSAGVDVGAPWPSVAVLGACLAWAVDNNLTRKVALLDATWLAAVKGAVAGPVNLALAFAVGATWPAAASVAGAMVVGFFAYGVSLVLFIVGIRHVGAARAGGYFAVAPFFGAAVAVVLGDPVGGPLVVAAGLMAVGVWLHLTETHDHPHRHEVLAHRHEHRHDEHHRHGHADPVGAGGRHSHDHTHRPLAHTHPHYPDSHHRHSHRRTT